MPSIYVDRLETSLRNRLDWFDEQVGETLAGLSGSWPGYRDVLGLFRERNNYIRMRLSTTVADTSEDRDKLGQMSSYVKMVDIQSKAFDLQFARDSKAIPSVLTHLVRMSTIAWDLEPEHLLLTVGPPANFTTRTQMFWRRVFAGQNLGSKQTLAISVPELEGQRASSVPIVVGHELAHYYFSRHQPAGFGPMNAEVEAVIRAATADGSLPDSGSGAPDFIREMGWKGTATGWLEELYCDAYCVHRFGPAGVAALLEYLSLLGDPATPTATHPPLALRAKLMLEWLNPTSGSDADKVSERFADIAAAPITNSSIIFVGGQLGALAARIWSDVSAWSAEPAYHADKDRIAELADLLRKGIPALHPFSSQKSESASAAEIVNASWLAAAKGPTRIPIDRLALKALDDNQFVEAWTTAGGSLTDHKTDRVAGKTKGTLSMPQIKKRLNHPSSERRIVMTPLVDNAIGPASVDLRLGNKFIIFERSANSAFDALDYLQDPRSMQVAISKGWGGTFYLHPGQLVLAATLEYLVMPNDLSAQVITRSSYGRLGLLSATAVQVHPGYHGCLTLELVNLGEMPIAITPGERVAQLMFFGLSDDYVNTPDDVEKYRYPTGPEFSKIRSDSESRVLQTMRNDFRRLNRPEPGSASQPSTS